MLWIRDVYSGCWNLDPGSRISYLVFRIPDPKTATKEKGKKSYLSYHFFVTTNITKFKNGFGIRDPGILDPGSRGQKGTGTQIPDRIRNNGKQDLLLEI